MRKVHRTSAPDLTEILTARETGTPAATWWPESDRALYAQTYREAVALYATAADPSPRECAKHGFCLGMEGDDDGAEALLSETNIGSHPEALAVLAWVLGGDAGRRMHGFGNAAATQRAAERRARVDALFKKALAHERPPPLVFNALFQVQGIYNENSAAQAARARMLYPDWAWPHGIVAGKQRVAGKLDPDILDDLVRTLPRARHEDVFHEAYVHAMKLGRWDDVERVIETLEHLVGKDTQAGDRNLASLTEMRAMLSLHRARAGESEAYESVLDQLETFMPAVPYMAGGRDPTVAPKFLLQVALETDRADRVRDAATALVERAWEAHGDRNEDLESWSPWIATPSLDGVLRFGHFGFDFTKRWREVEAELEGATRERWRLLIAADAVLHREPEPEQVLLLRTIGVQGQPWWIGRAIFEAHMNHAPEDPSGAGAVLAELTERAATMPPADDDRYPTPLEELGVDIKSLDDPVAMFSGALKWLRATSEATGQALLKEWGSNLATVDNGKPVLASLAALSLSRSDSAIAREMKALAEMPETPEDRLESILAGYPQPETTRVRAEDLTLLEAATLVALLRACALDHVHWTLAPLISSGESFEPTRKFIGTLFTLLDKGVIAIDASTPAGVVKAEEDGRLTAYLTSVVWRISANTLALQRDIRDLPRRQWPVAWRDHAPALVRDLGVEELVAYLDYLMRDRSLPVPNMDDARGLFRTQLEHLAIAQCYYLVHKSMRETLDYQARYRPGRAQLESRVINLLRGNGEKCIAQGWDTRYDRIRELPPSLLWQALNDVLTGWGRTAFDEPVITLMLDDSESSPTHD